MIEEPESQLGKPTPRKGLSHVFAAATYSLAGFQRLLDETAFRQEIVVCLVVIAIFVATGVPAWLYATQAILFLILFAVEAVNTAVEVLVDRISPDYAEFAGHAKDLGSFAVFCLLAGNGLHFVAALFMS